MQMHLVIEPAAQRRNVTYHNIKSKVDLESNYLIHAWADVSSC